MHLMDVGIAYFGVPPFALSVFMGLACYVNEGIS